MLGRLALAQQGWRQAAPRHTFSISKDEINIAGGMVGADWAAGDAARARRRMAHATPSPHPCAPREQQARAGQVLEPQARLAHRSAGGQALGRNTPACSFHPAQDHCWQRVRGSTAARAQTEVNNEQSQTDSGNVCTIAQGLMLLPQEMSENMHVSNLHLEQV